MLLRCGDLIWGLSTRPVDYQDSIPVILWVDNRSDKPAFVFTCSGLGYFWWLDIDIFDSSGHRVPSRHEQKIKNDTNVQLIQVCGRNFQIEIPAHSCMHTTFSQHAFDFFRDLHDGYDLPPGRYFIVPGERTPDFVPVERTVTNPKIALVLNIQKRGP